MTVVTLVTMMTVEEVAAGVGVTTTIVVVAVADGTTIATEIMIVETVIVVVMVEIGMMIGGTRWSSSFHWLLLNSCGCGRCHFMIYPFIPMITATLLLVLPSSLHLLLIRKRQFSFILYLFTACLELMLLCLNSAAR